MSLTFSRAKKKPRSDTKTSCPYLFKINRYISIYHSNHDIDYRTKRKMMVELKSYDIEEITDDVLKGYFAFKMSMPKTPYNREVLEYVKQYHNKTKYSAESIYTTAKSICSSLANSTIYYWFSRFGYTFSTAYDSYDPHIAIMIWYLAEIKKRLLAEKIANDKAESYTKFQ
jgi:hypothetical protein